MDRSRSRCAQCYANATTGGRVGASLSRVAAGGGNGEYPAFFPLAFLKKGARGMGGFVRARRQRGAFFFFFLL